MDLAIRRGPTAKNNFTLLSNEAFNAPLKADTLGVWLYLLSKPEDWEVVPQQLRKRFSVGRDAMRRIFRELTDYGVMVKQPRKGNAGKLNGWDYIVYEVPNDGFSGVRCTEALDNRPTGEPSDGKSALLQRTDDLQSTEEYLSRVRARPPTNFLPSPITQKRLVGRFPNVDVDRLLEHFKSIEFKRPSSWDARFWTYALEQAGRFSARASPSADEKLARKHSDLMGALADE